MLTFIHMPNIPFDYMIQRPQQLMKSLSIKNNKIYYIEAKPGNYIYSVNSNLNVVGIDYNFANINYNSTIILYCSSPDQVINIPKIPHDFVIYDVVDDASSDFSGWEEYVVPMLKSSQMVVTASRSLFEKFSKLHDNVYYIGNGVDTDNFALSINQRPKDIPSGRKVVGYVGAVAPWLDWNIIGEIVKDSKLNFVFVGPFFNKFRPFLRRSNIFYLGYRSYQSLPSYINSFDCCMIPFKINEMTENCCPIKLFEYFALGKPVVTTPIKEVLSYNSLCYVAHNETEFHEDIKAAAAENNSYIRQRRIEVAENNTWSKKADCLLSILKKDFNIE